VRRPDRAAGRAGDHQPDRASAGRGGGGVAADVPRPGAARLPLNRPEAA
jgi:hypothetical protein